MIDQLHAPSKFLFASTGVALYQSDAFVDVVYFDQMKVESLDVIELETAQLTRVTLADSGSMVVTLIFHRIESPVGRIGRMVGRSTVCADHSIGFLTTVRYHSVRFG